MFSQNLHQCKQIKTQNFEFIEQLKNLRKYILNF